MPEAVADYNVFTDNYPYARENRYARVNLYEELPIHTHDEEEGFFLVLEGNPEIVIGDASRVAEPGDLFHFDIGQLHGFNGEGKILAFHGRRNGEYGG